MASKTDPWRLLSFKMNRLTVFKVLSHWRKHAQKYQFSSVQSLSCVRLFATPWTAAHQASLSIANSWSLFKLMSIVLVMPSNHLSSSVVPFSCRQSLPASGSFQMSQFFTSSGQSIGVSASSSVLPMNIQDWFPLGWTDWISLQSKGLSRVFSKISNNHKHHRPLLCYPD